MAFAVCAHFFRFDAVTFVVARTFRLYLQLDRLQAALCTIARRGFMQRSATAHEVDLHQTQNIACRLRHIHRGDIHRESTIFDNRFHLLA